jgi:hypothetical protein
MLFEERLQRNQRTVPLLPVRRRARDGSSLCPRRLRACVVLPVVRLLENLGARARDAMRDGIGHCEWFEYLKGQQA